LHVVICNERFDVSSFEDLRVYIEREINKTLQSSINFRILFLKESIKFIYKFQYINILEKNKKIFKLIVSWQNKQLNNIYNINTNNSI